MRVRVSVGEEITRSGGVAGWAWWVGPVGPVVSWAEARGVSLPFFWSFVFLFCIFFLLFIFSSVLIQFKIFMHSVKVCFLHLKYLNIIWHNQNILFLMFENFDVCL